MLNILVEVNSSPTIFSLKESKFPIDSITGRLVTLRAFLIDISALYGVPVLHKRGAAEDRYLAALFR